jgi:hypothetical protein
MVSAPLWSDADAVQGVGAALGLVGVMQMANAARARPHADTRYWDNLPDGVHIATLARQAGPMRIQIYFKDMTGRGLSELTSEKAVDIGGADTCLVWVRSRESSFPTQ